MIQKIRKITAILIIVIVIMLLMPKDIKATQSLEELRKQYPTGCQWTESWRTARECHGFATMIYEKYYGVRPDGDAEVIYDVEQVQPGDIVRYNGHSVFVLSRNGENTTVAECNYDWQCHVRWDQPKRMAEYRNEFKFIIKAPYVLRQNTKSTKYATKCKSRFISRCKNKLEQSK